MPARRHKFANNLTVLVLMGAKYKHALRFQERHGSSAAFTGVTTLQRMLKHEHSWNGGLS